MLKFFVFVSRSKATHTASFLFSDSYFSAAQVLESCAGCVQKTALLCMQCGLNLLQGRYGLFLLQGRARVEKFFEQVTECWAKACELNQLKIAKHMDVQH